MYFLICANRISEVESGSGKKFGVEKALDVRYLEEVVSRFVEAPVAPSTRRTYLLGQRRYLIFVGEFS